MAVNNRCVYTKAFFFRRDVINFSSTLQEHISILLEEGWKIDVVENNRGICKAVEKQITIPLWVCSEEERNNGMQQWYVAHEVSHAFCFRSGNYDANHGPKFMVWLIRLCPESCIHWELTYKPRNAKVAGIGTIKPEEI